MANLRPSLVDAVDMVVMVITLVSELVLSHTYPIIIWGTCVTAGLSISTMASAKLSWSENHVNMNGRTTSILYLTGIVGMLVIPTITGTMMDKVSVIHISMSHAISSWKNLVQFHFFFSCNNRD